MTGVGVSFTTLGGRPVLVIDVPGEGRTGPLTAEDDPVVWSFTSRGLRLLPAFLDQNLVDAADLLLAVGHGQVALATPEEVDVLAVPIEEVPEAWLEAAEEHAGVVVLVGRDVEVAALDNEVAIGRQLDRAASAARLLGAAVPVD